MTVRMKFTAHSSYTSYVYLGGGSRSKMYTMAKVWQNLCVPDFW
jgi:hypothetical protein